MNYILDTNIITAHMENNEKIKMKLGEVAKSVLPLSNISSNILYRYNITSFYIY